MKMLFFALFTLISAGCQKSQNVPAPVQVVHVESSIDPSKAHLSANTFVRKMDAQRAALGYPIRVTSPAVKIEPVTVGGRVELQFTWSASLVACSEAEADRHFDRRGTLWSGKTKMEAAKGATLQLERSDKVGKMVAGFHQQFGNHRMSRDFVSESSCKMPDGKWFCVREFFCTAK